MCGGEADEDNEVGEEGDGKDAAVHGAKIPPQPAVGPAALLIGDRGGGGVV